MKINTPSHKSSKALLLAFVLVMVVAGVYFVFRSFAAEPLPTGANDTIIELSRGDVDKPQSTTLLSTPETLPFRLYGNGLAICGDYPDSDTKHAAQYYSKQLSPSQLHTFIAQLNKDDFSGLNQSYVSTPGQAIASDAETITYNTKARSVQVTTFGHDKQSPPKGFTTAKTEIKKFCNSLTQPYTAENIAVYTAKVDASQLQGATVSEALPIDIQAPNSAEGETIHTQEKATSTTAKRISEGARAGTKAGSKFYKKGDKAVQVVTSPVLPETIYRAPTNRPSPPSVSQRIKNIFSHKANANANGYFRFALFCPAGGAGCSPRDIDYYANSIRNMYTLNTGKAFDVANIGIIYGNQPAGFYQSSDPTVAFQRVYNEMDARGLLTGNSPLELISGFSFGVRSWCGVGSQTSGFPAKAMALTDPSNTGNGGVCAGNTLNGSGYEFRSAAHELGHNLTLAHTTGMGQAGGIMGYDYNCNWAICGLAAFQVPIIANHPLLAQAPIYQGRLDAFVRGGDKHLWHVFYDGYNWSRWEDLGQPSSGGLASGPAVASWGANRLDVFAKDASGKLAQKSWNGSRWSSWTILTDSPLASAPAAVSFATGRIDVFARNSANKLIHKWYQSGFGWNSGWEVFNHGNQNGSILSSPAVASKGFNSLDVFARGTDNRVYTIRWDNGWSGWSQVPPVNGSATYDSPTAVSWGPSRIDAFVRGTNNQLYTNWYAGGIWNSGWVPLGGILSSAPAVASRRPNNLDAFVRGSDGALWHNWFDWGWHGFGSLGAPPSGISSAPTAVSWDN